MNESKGVIYILTNPSFPDLVKIGYASDINERLKSLNRSEAIPYPFQIYATYKVNSNLSDVKLHSIIDKLNPSLRTRYNENGRKRVREFYVMDPKDAYAILEALAEIHDCTDNLTRYTSIETKKIEKVTSKKAHAYSFFDCNINVGEQIEFIDDPSIVATVVSKNEVEYKGVKMSMTALAQKLRGTFYKEQGPKYFKYKGENLLELRKRLGV